MSTKVLFTPEVQQQIELFYKLSNFLSKYAILVFSFFFAVVFVLFFSINTNFKVVSYSSDILNPKSAASF